MKEPTEFSLFRGVFLIIFPISVGISILKLVSSSKFRSKQQSKLIFEQSDSQVKHPQLEHSQLNRIQIAHNQSTFECPPMPNTSTFNFNARTQVPYFNLRRDKFLIAVPIYGPNNQMNGIQESIGLAIKLNRTFVLPKLYRHHSDQRANGLNQFNEKVVIDPGIRIDIKELNKLLPTVFIEDIIKYCKTSENDRPNGPDAIFPSHNDKDWIGNLNRRRYIKLFDLFQVSPTHSFTLFNYTKKSSNVKNGIQGRSVKVS